jgi:hypothetical protein
MNVEEKFIKRGVQILLVLTQAVLLFKIVNSYSLDLILAICIVATILILTFNMENLKSISLGKDGLKAELEVLQKKTDESISLSMGKDAYTNLQKLASGKFGKYRKERHVGLETELYYLRNLGYVELIPDSARSIHEIPESGDELSQYIRVTEEGLRYIKLRGGVDRKD